MNKWPKSPSHISNSLVQTLVCALEFLSINNNVREADWILHMQWMLGSI